MAEKRRPRFAVGDTKISAGWRKTFEIPVTKLPTGSSLSMPITVVNGIDPGPVIWLSGAIHGDELNGVEIVQQLLKAVSARTLSGTIIAVPVVNVLGFINQTRTLPDGRDLNRSFPGSTRGSMAAQVARLFMSTVVERCQYGIDFHTATSHRVNIPQIRAAIDDPETRKLALAFGAEVTLDARARDGSLREAAAKKGRKVLLFEGGESQRFERGVISAGVVGTLRVLGELGMLPTEEVPPPDTTFVSRKSTWVRARRAGVLRLDVRAGDDVEKGDVLGTIGPVGSGKASRIKATTTGRVIGMSLNPLIAQGGAIANIAEPEPTPT